MIDELLPVGSVVLTKGSQRKVMIVGVCQKGGAEHKLWDYAAVIFPEGYLSADKIFLFNNDQIERVYFMGYQDPEQIAFKEKAEEVMAKARTEEEQKES